MGFATSALQHHHLLAAAGETWRVARGLHCSLLRKPFLPQRHQLLPQRKQPATRRQACCAQKKGFGSGSKTKSKRKRSGPALQESNPEWVPVAMVSEFKDGKDTLPKILRDNSAIVLYQVGSEIYCSDANSTAFKFPLIDANVIEREDGPAVEVPLDGTVYDLETGEVLEWCPRNNPVRFVLGALKEKSEPKNLRVYPARVNGEGKIFVKFAPDSSA